MSHGFVAVNNNNQVLVSSETRNLHFIGKATYSSLRYSRNNYGGCRQWLFNIACNDAPVPFFTMPTADTYGVTSIKQVSSGQWEIELTQSGTSNTPPEVYVFGIRSAFPGPILSNFGMQVLRNDGDISFDSRLLPLAVTGGGLVIPPESPVNPAWYIHTRWDSYIGLTQYGWWRKYADYTQYMNDRSGPYWVNSVWQGSYWLDYPYANKGTGDATNTLVPTNSSEYSLSIGDGNTKPIFMFPSLAQATRIVSSTYNENEGDYACMSNYWAMYRSGIKYVSGKLYCGWVIPITGVYWRAIRVDYGVTIGSGVDASSVVGAGSGGQPPYFNETLNLQPTAVMIANGARYD